MCTLVGILCKAIESNLVNKVSKAVVSESCEYKVRSGRHLVLNDSGRVVSILASAKVFWGNKPND